MAGKTPWTPGPLIVDGFADCQEITKDVPVAIGRPIGIARVYGPNMIADARLFGAAPEMAEALRLVVALADGDDAETGADGEEICPFELCRALLSRIEGGEA